MHTVPYKVTIIHRRITHQSILTIAAHEHFTYKETEYRANLFRLTPKLRSNKVDCAFKKTIDLPMDEDISEQIHVTDDERYSST